MPKKSFKGQVEAKRRARREKNKPDFVFLDSEKRRDRVVRTIEQCDRFAGGMINILDSLPEGSTAGIAVDIECDWVDPDARLKRKKDPHFWSRRLLGCPSKETYESRMAQNEKIDQTYKALLDRTTDDDTYIATYWEWCRQRHEMGVPKTDVLAIQVALTADPEGDFTFAIHVRELVESGPRNQVKLPEVMEKLLTHKNAVLFNANQYADIRAILNTFYPNGRLDNIRYVEAHDLFQKGWGPEWGPSGVLTIFEKAFLHKNWTWDKDLAVTCSHWWKWPWTDKQILYALSDSETMKMAANETFDDLSTILRMMAKTFPLKFVDPEVQLRKSKKASNSKAQAQRREVTDPCHRPPSINKNKLGPFAYPESDAESNSDDDIFMSRPYYAVRTIIHEIQTTTVRTTTTYDPPTSATTCPRSPVSPVITGFHGDGQTATTPTTSATTCPRSPVSPVITGFHSDGQTSATPLTTLPTPSFEDQIKDLNDHCADNYEPMIYDDDVAVQRLAEERPDVTTLPDEYQFEEEDLTLDDELTKHTDHNKNNHVMLSAPNAIHDMIPAPPLVGRTTTTIQQLISRIAVGQMTESIRIIKLMPSATMQTDMADAISLSTSVKLHVRKNIHKICRYLGTLFITEEKERFLNRLAQVGSPVDFASIMLDLKYADFEPVLALSGDITTTVALLRLRPGMESQLAGLLGDLYTRPWDHKVTVMRACKWYAKKLELHYTKWLQDGYLKACAYKLSYAFEIPIPIGLRRQTARHRVANICTSVSNGRLSGTEALKKCLLLAGDDSQAKATTLDAAGLLAPLHHALAKIWGVEADPAIEPGQTLSDSTPCGKKDDYCHSPPVTHSKITSDAQAMSAIEVLREARSAYMATRSINDPTTFIDNPGMVSFMIMGGSHIYHFFPSSKRALSRERLSQLVLALTQCRLYVWGGTRCRKQMEKLGAVVRDCVEVLSHPLCKNTKGNIPERIYFAATGRRYCSATYENIFREPGDGDSEALTHVGSELYATSILYPGPS
jgi:hypothetical protein